MAPRIKAPTSDGDIRVTLKNKLRSLAMGEKPPDNKVKITRTISGGAPGERFSRRLEILGNGKVEFEELDEIKDRVSRKYSTTLSKRSLGSVFTTLHNAGLMDLKESGQGFLPDSLIGSVTVEIDGEKHTYYYLADDEERRAQGQILKQPLAATEQMAQRIELQTVRKDDVTIKKLRDKLANKKSKGKGG